MAGPSMAPGQGRAPIELMACWRGLRHLKRRRIPVRIRKRIGALKLVQGQGKPWEHLTDTELQARIAELSPVLLLEHGLPDDFALTTPWSDRSSPTHGAGWAHDHALTA